MKFIKKNWHYIVLVFLSLTPVVWFLGKGDVIINGVDTNFPLDPVVWFERRFYVWDSVINAGRDFSNSTAGMLFHLIQVIPYKLGTSLQNTQIFSFIFWFSSIVLSSYFFAKVILPKNKTAQIILVIIYSFNIYLFNTWENVKVSNLALYVSLPIFLAILVAFKNKKISLGRIIPFSILGGLFAAGAGLNPAYFITIILGVLIFWIVTSFVSWDRKEFLRLSKGTFLSLIFLFLINSFWIFPTIKFLFFSGTPISNLTDIGFTNWIDSLSENTSLVNVLRLQGAWDWYAFDELSGFPLYLPYALNYHYNPPFIIFSFALPFLALLSFAFAKVKDRGYIYAVFGIFLVLGVFLGAGSHEPTGTTYKFLARNVPFFSFFRSPWYIFTPLVTISYAGLAAFLYNRLSEASLEKYKFYKKFNLRHVLNLAVLVFMAGHFLYSYPLATGKIFRPSREDGFYVNFPDYVWQTKDNLQQDGKNFPRFVSYPHDDIENFDWGYRGIESILGLFSDQEVVSPSFIQSDSGLKTGLDQFYKHIKRGEYESAISMLDYFGADTIFYKKDTDTLAPSIVEEELVDVEIERVGEWSFIKSNDSWIDSKFYSPSRVYLNESDNHALAGVVKLLDDKYATVDSKDSRLGKIELETDNFLSFSEARNLTYDENPAAENHHILINVSKEGEYYLALERYGIQNLSEARFSLDQTTISDDLINPTDSLLLFGPLQLSVGEHEFRANRGEVQEIFPYDDYTEINVSNGLVEEVEGDIEELIVAFNESDEREDVFIPIEEFDPYSKYLLEFESRYLYGTVSTVELLQGNERTPLRSFKKYTGSIPDWIERNEVIDPVDTESNLNFLITLPGDDKGGTSKSLFRDVSLKRVFDNRLFLLEDGAEVLNSPDSLRVSKISPVEYEVKVDGGRNGYFLVFLDNYSQDWQIKSDDILPDPVHFMANGYANGWYIRGGKDEQVLSIYYHPQRIYHVGFAVSLLSALAGLFLYKFKLSK